MELIRHPGYMEIKFPELLEPDPQLDNIARVFTAVQPGTNNLLINLSEYRGRKAELSESHIVHSTRTIVAALESMSDVMEQIAIYVRSDHAPTARAYAQHLEDAGYRTRLFTDRLKALGWIGMGD